MCSIASLWSIRACKCFRISTHSDKYILKPIARAPSRGYAQSTEKQPPLKLPSFSTKSGKKPGTNFDGFLAEPPLSVYYNTIWNKAPNYDNLPEKILKKLDQSPNELLKGTSLAIEAVTSAISSQRLDAPEIKNSENAETESVLQDCLTTDCHYRLRNCYLSMPELQDKHFLVNIQKDDIVFSWIHSLKVDEFDSILMKVGTISFPQFSFLVKKRNEYKELRKKLYTEIKNLNHPEDEQKVKDRLEEFKSKGVPSIDGYDIREFIKVHDVVVSNFLFKLGPNTDDSWLMDDIMMRNAAETFSTIKCLRWKGRTVLSLVGLSFQKIFITDMLYFGMVTPLIASIL